MRERFTVCDVCVKIRVRNEEINCIYKSVNIYTYRIHTRERGREKAMRERGREKAMRYRGREKAMRERGREKAMRYRGREKAMR